MKIKYHLFILFLFGVSFVVQAQRPQGNVFLDKGFWEQDPSVEEVKSLVEAGNDPVAMNDHGFNGTTYAILNKASLDVVKYMLSLKGNDVNTLTHDGRTYLHWAAAKDRLDVMKYLIEKKARTDIVDDHGYTVLCFAATTGQTNQALYDLLFTHGAKVAETNHDGANALLLLLPHLKDFTMVDYFTSKGLSLNATDKEGNGAFFYAAKAGNIDMMNQLIDKGIDDKGKNKLGGNAMMAASEGTRRKSNSLEVFTYLEEKGIDPNVVTTDKRTPLHPLASKSKDEEVIRYFIDKGVDVNLADEEGNTALMNAAARNDLGIVKLLAAHTKDINVQNNKGETALLKAVEGNSAEVVNFLIGEGANIKAKDHDGNGIGYYLIASYRPAGGHFGGRPGVKGEAPKDPFEAKLSLLQQKGFNATATQAKGNTLYHLAAAKNDLKLLKKIQTMGLDINQANDEGTTPIQIAAMKATDDAILKYMIAQGADTQVVTDFDESVYDLASENEVLQKKGVDINFLKL